MATVTFDALKFVECLKKHNFTDEQAKGLSEALKEAQDSSLRELATKHDLKELELRLRHDLTLRLGGMLVAGIAIVATLVKLL